MEKFSDAYKEAIAMAKWDKEHDSAVLKEALPRKPSPYQTYEEITGTKHDYRVRPAPDTLERLFWTLNGPLETAIGVLGHDDADNNQTCVPYYDAVTSACHPVSLLPLSEPRVSSITEHVFNLRDWETCWDLLHYEHWENYGPTDEELEVGQDGGEEKPGDYDFEPEWGVVKTPYRGGDRNDDDEDDDLEHVQVMKCCCMPRPFDRDATIVVRPSNTAGQDGGYVTVHDYVTAVHPWIMSLRGDILNAMGMSDGRDDPLPDDTSLMFAGYTLNDMRIKTMGAYLQWNRNAPQTVAQFTTGQDVGQDTGKQGNVLAMYK